jgi:hypothetical protein|tara:strand:+ start:332 stop:556 length:225 start_codon:yes stop_codon:yes gene_type:complete
VSKSRQKRYVTTQEAADFLSVDPSWVRYLVRKKKLKAELVTPRFLLISRLSLKNYARARAFRQVAKQRKQRHKS